MGISGFNIYVYIYYLILLFITLYTSIQMSQYPQMFANNLKLNKERGFFLLILSFLLLGFSNYSGNLHRATDTHVYTLIFENLNEINWGKLGDPLFYLLMYTCKSLGLTIDVFYIACAFLYCSVLFLVCRRINKEYCSFYFLMIVCSFSFVAYATNVIRNGLSLSIILLACTYYEEKAKMISLFIVALLFHLSGLLLIGSFFIAFYFPRFRLYIKIWLFALLISYMLGNYVVETLQLEGIIGERLGGYLETDSSEVYKKMGFRWDFIFYSSLPIIYAYYFIVKKKFVSSYFLLIVNIYTIANTVWLMFIRVPFSDRFAALSWFFMPQIFLYPLLERKSEKNRIKKVAGILFLNFSFTYVMYLVRY